MGQYTYLVGLIIMGLAVFAFGMFAAERERRARGEHGASRPEKLPTSRAEHHRSSPV
jgi:flagellar biosynthesis/type III secretory pathway M-ring protein FliF/YscJ